MGIDPLRDVDRIGLTEHGVVISGDFRRANWEGLLGSASGTPYGERGQITELDPRREGGARLVAARWGDSLLQLGSSEDDARRMLDAVEGRGPEPRPLLSPEQSYGELYGILSGPDLRSEEHTSELQSRENLVCRLLLEKKKKKKNKKYKKKKKKKKNKKKKKKQKK